MKILVTLSLFFALTLPVSGEDLVDWPFDQSGDVAALTTNQVINEGLPILLAIHYADDHSWAFTCGTTNKSSDVMLVSMHQIVSRDPSLYSIADLPPGWSATRESVDSEWVRVKDE